MNQKETLMGTLQRPHVLMISEITADGKLTLGKGVSSKLLMKHMSHEAEILLHETRAEYDAIMVGSSTIQSQIAPKSLFFPVMRATEPSVRSRMPEIRRSRLPIRNDWQK